jgi:hypothetical protein
VLLQALQSMELLCKIVLRHSMASKTHKGENHGERHTRTDLE